MSSKNPRKTRSFGSGKKAVKKFKVGGTSATPISAREAAMLRAINNLIASQGSTRGGPTMRGRVVANPSGITRLGPLKLDRRSPFEKSLSPAQARIYNRMIEERDSGPFVDSMNRNFPVEAQLAKQYLGAPAGGGFGTVPAGTPGSGDSLNAIRDAQSAAAVQQLRDAANARAMAAAQQAAAAKNTYKVIPTDLAGNPLPTFDQPSSGSSGSSSGSGFRGPSSSAFSYGSRLPAVNPPPSITPDPRVTVAPISSGEEDMDVDPIYRPDAMEELGLYRGGRARSVKRYASGGAVRSSASKRGDGIARKGKTRGKFVR